MFGSGEEVQVMPGNQEVFTLLTLDLCPWRVGWGGPYGLDRNLLRNMAEDLGIERDAAFYVKLRAFEEEALKMMSRKKPKNGDPECNEDECRILYGEHFEWACKNCREMAKGKDE